VRPPSYRAGVVASPQLRHSTRHAARPAK
jgi:hypothetical protein